MNLLIFSTSANSQVLLEQNALSPFRGILLPIDTAQKLRIELLEKDKYKELSESLERSNSILNANIGLLEQSNKTLLEQNDTLAKELHSAQSVSTVQKLLYFGGGIVLTVLIGFTVKQAITK